MMSPPTPRIISAHLGIDEGWEDCKAGPAGTQHDAAGNPIINTTRFPDLASLVAAAHAEKLEIGWYLNGCACGETSEHTINYEGDIKQLHALGFDAAKFDNCGAQKNMTLYASLMQATGKAYMIENCHWGQCPLLRHHCTAAPLHRCIAALCKDQGDDCWCACYATGDERIGGGAVSPAPVFSRRPSAASTMLIC